jgi:hypothetical protein
MPFGNFHFENYDLFPETSVINYHFSLPNNPEERSSPLLRGGSQKSRNFHFL